MSIRIIDYYPVYQEDIDLMMDGIQDEFPIAITGPTSALLNEFYKEPGYKFWIAMYGDVVAGTIGVKLFGTDKAEIKRMMVGRKYRGALYNTATLLMETALKFSREKNVREVYLGTMQQFIAAQKFYLKNGFVPVEEKDLPSDYVINPMDKLFYKLEL